MSMRKRKHSGLARSRLSVTAEFTCNSVFGVMRAFPFISLFQYKFISQNGGSDKKENNEEI